MTLSPSPSQEGKGRVNRFPNLSSPVWDAVRIPVRRPIGIIANQICAEAGVNPDDVRAFRRLGREASPALHALRARIMVEVQKSGFTPEQAQAEWFIGFQVTSLKKYLVQGRKMLEAENA